MPPERRLAAILHADVVGYSRLMAEDEDATVRLVTAYREVIELLVHQHRGEVVDFTGDNFLAEFGGAVAAVECAIELQRVLKARNAPLPDDRKMQFRMGVHLGEVRVEGERRFGTGVNVAARIQALAEPGGLCISSKVHDELRNKLAVDSEDLGEREVKNVPERVHVYRVKVEPVAVSAPATGRGRRAVLAAGVVVALGAVALGWWSFRPTGARTAAVTAPIRSLAVLPLRSLSADPDQEYFATGMTDAVIGALARIEALPVISLTSVVRYRNTERPLPEIAQELGVDGIIEGTVLRAEGRVRIAVQLIDGRSDVHLWNESYERELSDVLALQNEVAVAVARQVEAVLSPEEQAELAQVRRVDPEAYDAYLRGKHFLSYVEGDADRAIEYFERAIELDPAYAPAYVGLAEAVRTVVYLLRRARREEVLPGIRANLERALELDARLPDAYAERAIVSWRFEWKWEEAERDFQRALELGPGEADVLRNYSWFLAVSGRHDEALDLARRSIKLAPLDLSAEVQLAMNLRSAGGLDQALEALERLLEVNPRNWVLHFVAGALHREQGRDREAVRAYVTSLRLRGAEQLARAMEHGYASSGYLGVVRAFIDAATQQPESFDPETVAAFCADIGEVELAFEWLERGFRERAWGMPRMKTEPAMRALRSDPRFDDLLRRIGFPEG